MGGANEAAHMEELCGAMMELLTKPYEQHMIDFLCDAEHYFGMTRNDCLLYTSPSPRD